MAEISLEPAPPQARPKGPDLPSLPTTESETDDEDADIENCEDRPLLSMAGGPGKGEGGIPLGNFNYPVTSDSGPQPSLTCANLPPTYVASKVHGSTDAGWVSELLPDWRAHADRCGRCLASFERAASGYLRARGCQTAARSLRRWTGRLGLAGLVRCASFLHYSLLPVVFALARSLQPRAVDSSRWVVDGVAHLRLPSLAMIVSICVQPMLLLTYALVIGISCSLFSMSVRLQCSSKKERTHS